MFQDGASPAFHEAVGDSMIYAIQAPSHIERFGFGTGSGKNGKLISYASNHLKYISNFQFYFYLH